MSQLIAVTISLAGKDIAYDDFAEYDRKTKTVSAMTVRWSVPKPDDYVNKTVLIKAKFQKDSSPFINDMRFTYHSNDYLKCAFQGN